MIACADPQERSQAFGQALTKLGIKKLLETHKPDEWPYNFPLENFDGRLPAGWEDALKTGCQKKNKWHIGATFLRAANTSIYESCWKPRSESQIDKEHRNGLSRHLKSKLWKAPKHSSNQSDTLAQSEPSAGGSKSGITRGTESFIT